MYILPPVEKKKTLFPTIDEKMQKTQFFTNDEVVN